LVAQLQVTVAVGARGSALEAACPLPRIELLHEPQMRQYVDVARWCPSRMSSSQAPGSMHMHGTLGPTHATGSASRISPRTAIQSKQYKRLSQPRSEPFPLCEWARTPSCCEPSCRSCIATWQRACSACACSCSRLLYCESATIPMCARFLILTTDLCFRVLSLPSLQMRLWVSYMRYEAG